MAIGVVPSGTKVGGLVIYPKGAERNWKKGKVGSVACVGEPAGFWLMLGSEVPGLYSTPAQDIYIRLIPVGQTPVGMTVKVGAKSVPVASLSRTSRCFTAASSWRTSARSAR